ncbi:MAG: NAD-dependent epimerase/dehydratase family protein, partial [Planctomycetales bacterium]|nr:NAD-dependent epimerase/dehydratase family protein [Planctomycetales bacterium]
MIIKAEGAAPRWRKVLVTGGSGFNGINLIRDLLDRGVAVRSLDLAEFTYPDCRDRIEAVVGDIRDPAVVARCM